MPIVTRQPTSFQTPDPGQGGTGVTDPSTTGHGNTQVSTISGLPETKTCKWSGFQGVNGQVTAISLKFDWLETGSPGDGTTLFETSYSVNNGSSWTTIFSHSVNGTISSSSTIQSCPI